MSSEVEPAWDDWAKYYDLVDQDRSPFIDFYTSLLDQDTRHVIELACGTGRIISAIAERLLARRAGGEFRIVGSDESPQMLEQARARDSRVTWALDDLRRPTVAGPFDLVICCYNTLQHMLSDDDLLTALQASRALLAPRGRCAFDIYQPNLTYLTKPARDKLARSIADPSGRSLEIRENLDYTDGILTIDWRLIERGKPQFALARTRYRYRQYDRQHLDALMQRAGLIVRERYGNFDRSPWTASAKKQILVCERA